MSDLVTEPAIREVADRIRGLVVRTPLVPLALPAGGRLLVKPESLQPVGAFKLRGAFAAITALPAAARQSGVVAHSSGNHAQAVAYAARALGVRAVLVLPRTTAENKVARCAALGAEIVFVEPTMADRVETADRLAAAHGLHLIPPFDDPQVIAGQGTVGLEIVADAPEVDLVLVPVSGGGLIAGVAAAVKTLRPGARVIGVEPEDAADARDSLAAGHPVAWPDARVARTIADALRVTRVGRLPFAHIEEYVDGFVTVTDDEIKAAMRTLALDARLVAEPAGAAATAAALFRGAELPAATTTVAVLSGGNVEPGLLREVLG